MLATAWQTRRSFAQLNFFRTLHTVRARLSRNSSNLHPKRYYGSSPTAASFKTLCHHSVIFPKSSYLKSIQESHTRFLKELKHLPPKPFYLCVDTVATSADHACGHVIEVAVVPTGLAVGDFADLYFSEFACPPTTPPAKVCELAAVTPNQLKRCRDVQSVIQDAAKWVSQLVLKASLRDGCHYSAVLVPSKAQGCSVSFLLNAIPEVAEGATSLLGALSVMDPLLLFELQATEAHGELSSLTASLQGLDALASARSTAQLLGQSWDAWDVAAVPRVSLDDYAAFLLDWHAARESLLDEGSKAQLLKSYLALPASSRTTLEVLMDEVAVAVDVSVEEEPSNTRSNAAARFHSVPTAAAVERDTGLPPFRKPVLSSLQPAVFKNTYQELFIKFTQIKALTQPLPFTFDMEATGFSVYHARMFQIAAVPVGLGKDIEFSEYIRISCRIPSDVVALTGVTNDKLKGCRELPVVLNSFFEFIARITINASITDDVGYFPVLIAHNAFVYDVPLLLHEMQRHQVDTSTMHKMQVKFADSLAHMRKLKKQERLPESLSTSKLNLQTLASTVDGDRKDDNAEAAYASQFHDALHDAKALAKVLRVLDTLLDDLDLFTSQDRIISLNKRLMARKNSLKKKIPSVPTRVAVPSTKMSKAPFSSRPRTLAKFPLISKNWTRSCF